MKGLLFNTNQWCIMPWICSHKIIKDNNILSDRTKFLKNWKEIHSVRIWIRRIYLSFYSVVVFYSVVEYYFQLIPSVSEKNKIAKSSIELWFEFFESFFFWLLVSNFFNSTFSYCVYTIWIKVRSEFSCGF